MSDVAEAMARVSADRVLAWRLGRQLLSPRGRLDAATTVRRLCGVQAQVASAARLAVASRQLAPQPDEVSRALADRSLVKTWAMRGTLHLLHPADAAAYLSLVAAGRPWEKGSWQRTFVTTAQLDAITATVREVLRGKVLSRDELGAAVVGLTGDDALAGHWAGLPTPEEAAAVVIPAYLAAYGPATPEAFDAWLTRGGSKKAALRGWFSELADEVVSVDVEGTRAYARAGDLDDIASTSPSRVVRLLPGFDQYVLGPGTRDTAIIPARRRAQISKAAGWISPVVVTGGRVAGTWEITDGIVEVVLFGEAGSVPAKVLEAETDPLGSFLGEQLRLSVHRD